MTEKEKNFVSAVVYVHNAQDRIKAFLSVLIDTIEKNFEHSEIICVNDYSEDDSLAYIREISQKAACTNISVVNMSCFHGLELAMNAGIDLAIGDFVFEFDNTIPDFSPDVIMDIYYKALEGYDIVSASANRKEKFSSKLFYKVFDRYTDASCKMSTESFRVLSRRVLNRIDSMNKFIPYRKAVYAKCGLKATGIMYNVQAHKALSGDKRETKYRTGLAVDSLIMFTDVGYRFSIWMTILMMCISIFMVIYSVIVYATSNPVAGWTTTILFLSVAFFGVFGIMTIIVKYLQLLVDLVFKRKQYSYESIEKITK